MKLLSINELFSLSYLESEPGLQRPFRLNIEKFDSEKKDYLPIEQSLRFLPGKRLACKSELNGKMVFAKIFSPQAKAQYQTELQGITLLQEAGIKHAPLLNSIETESYGIVFQQWLEGETLQLGSMENIAHIKSALTLLAELHKKNIIHADIHINNLLCVEDEIYVLDAGAVQLCNNRKAKQENLALFIAQFPLSSHKDLINKKDYYEKIVQVEIPHAELAKQVKNQWSKRKNSYLKKIFRSCSDIGVWETEKTKIVYTRKNMNNHSLQELAGIEEAMRVGKMIKDSRNTTVVLSQIGKQKVVIKRYQNTNRLTALRRRLKISRARNNWYFSHLLSMLGINTPAPIALIEKRNHYLDYLSYYVNEYEAGDNAYDAFVKIKPNEQQLEQIQQTFNSWKLAGIEHGDCKSTNWVVGKKKIWVVDLDAMQEVSRVSDKDSKRFLRDWKKHPALQKTFNRLLSK